MTSVEPRPKTGKKRVSKPSTDRRVATELHSKIVRSRGRCEYSGAYAKWGNTDNHYMCEGPLQAAHIIRRRYAATRTDTANSVCLCARHHAYLDNHLAELIGFVGEATYRRLQAKADGGIAATGMSPLIWWRSERARLTEVAKELGLSR